VNNIICVGAIIENEKGKVLFMKRTKNCKYDADMWSVPAGKVQANETPEEAIVREIREELGIDSKIVGKIYESKEILDEKKRLTTIAYVCRVVKGEPEIKEPEKCSEVAFFSIRSLPSPLVKRVEKIISVYKKWRIQKGKIKN
jgi:mutator protein MutT